jgi:hypothetical protein
VRKLLRSLATLAALHAANAALGVANAALRTAPGPDRGAPAIEEAGVVVTDEPSRGFTYDWEEPEPELVEVTLTPRPSIDGLEYACRLLMAELAKMPPARGFDTGRDRRFKRDEIDDALDLYNFAAQMLVDD